MLRILLLAFFLLINSVADAGMIIRGSSSCVGYEANQTDCATPVYGGSADSLLGDMTYTRTWTATEAGTAKSIDYYPYANCGTGAVWTVVFYVNTELRGTGTSTCSADSWINGILSSYSGRSLTFSSSDVIKYGVSVDYGTSGAYMGRQSDSGGDQNYYSETSYLPDPFSDTTSAVYELMTIFHYER
jgi:hypothetical protein